MANPQRILLNYDAIALDGGDFELTKAEQGLSSMAWQASSSLKKVDAMFIFSRARQQSPLAVLSWRGLLVAALFAFMLAFSGDSPPVAVAQNPTSTPRPNPSVASCGLPASGTVYQAVTYTLSANCTQTDQLDIQAAVTVVGGGYTIDGSRVLPNVFSVNSSGSLTMSNATVKSGGLLRAGGVEASGGSISISNVTFSNTYKDTVKVSGSGGTYSLSNVLIENAVGAYFYHGLTAASLQAESNAQLSVTNLVISGSSYGNAAIGAIGGARITIGGCFTWQRVFPQLTAARGSGSSITDNSTGGCTGSIGNGGTVKRYPGPRPAACGLPSEGFLLGSATFSLRSDCQQTGPLYIRNGLNVTIKGNGYTIQGASRGAIFRTAGRFTIRNVVISGSYNEIIGAYLQNNLLIERTIFRANEGAVVLADHRATLNNVAFENNRTAISSATGASAVRAFNASVVTIRDSGFYNNSAGSGVIYVHGNNTYGDDPRVILAGCITWENNRPANISDPFNNLTDNSTGPCATRLRIAPEAVEVEASPIPPPPRPDTCQAAAEVEAFAMGAAACIFRMQRGQDYLLSVYGINAQSEGYHMLTVSQSHLNTLGGGSVVGVSPDGRAVVTVSHDRKVTAAMGPDGEGKVMHYTFDGWLGGAVVGIRTTYGEAPGLAYLKSGGEQSRPVESLSQCLATTTDILNLRASPGGDVIGLVGYDVSLWAMARESGWYQVSVDGQIGWISGDYVWTRGNCG